MKRLNDWLDKWFGDGLVWVAERFLAVLVLGLGGVAIVILVRWSLA